MTDQSDLSENSQQLSPLALAAVNGRTETLKTLVANPEVMFETQDYAEALLLAKNANKTDSYNFLINNWVKQADTTHIASIILSHLINDNQQDIVRDILAADKNNKILTSFTDIERFAIFMYFIDKDYAVDILKKLISHGTKINESFRVNRVQYTPLSYAAEKGNLEVVKFLLEQPGIDLEDAIISIAAKENPSKDIFSLLVKKAFEKDQLSVLQPTFLKLLTKGDLDGVKAVIEADKEGKIIFFDEDALQTVFENGYTDIVAALVKHPKFDVQQTYLINNKPHTPLAVAAAKGQFETLKILVTHPKVMSDTRFYAYALTLAAHTKQNDSYNLLIKNWVEQADKKEAKSIINILLAERRHDIVKDIFVADKQNKIMSSFSDIDRLTIFTIFINKVYAVDILNILILNGTHVNEKFNINGVPYTLFKFAAEKGSLEVVKFLADQPEFELEEAIKFIAAQKNPSKDVLNILINKYIEIGQPEKVGEIILGFLQRDEPNLEAAKAIIEADKENKLFGGPEKFNMEVLRIALEKGQLDIVKALIPKKFDVNVKIDKNNSYYTPLMLAADFGDLALVKYLTAQPGIQIDPDPNEPGIKAPLMLAVEHNQKDVVKYLVDKEANLKVNDSLSRGLLSKAKTPDIVKLLIEAGAPRPNVLSPLPLGATDNEKSKFNYLLMAKNKDKFNEKWGNFEQIQKAYFDEGGKTRGAQVKTFFKKTEEPSSKRKGQLQLLSDQISLMDKSPSEEQILGVFVTIGYVRAQVKDERNVFSTRLEKMLDKLEEGLKDLGPKDMKKDNKIETAIGNGATAYQNELKVEKLAKEDAPPKKPGLLGK